MKFLGSVFSTLNELASPSTWFDSDAAEDTTSGAATLNGHVDFACVAALSVTAHLREEAAVAEGGIGTATITARQILRAQVAFAGVGASSFTAHVIEKASLADAGVGTLSATGRQILRAVVSFVVDSAFLVTARMLLRAAAAGSGVGEFTADGHVVSGASTLNGHVDFSATSALAVAAPTELLKSQVSFDSSASLAATAHQILNAQVAFAGSANLTVGAPPVVLEPTLDGGGGVSSGPRPRLTRPSRRRIALRAVVAFRVESVFAARADVVPAEISLPFLEEPTTDEVLIAPIPVVRFAPAIVGQIDTPANKWTDEEMLTALFMFEEAA